MDNNIVKSNLKFPIVDNRFTPSKKLKYPMNDLSACYTHYDPSTGRNIRTPNVLPTIKEDK